MRYIGYHENKSRGTFGFPIQLYYVDSSHPQYEMPFHWHMECELILVLGGKFHLSINGVSHTLEKGRAFLYQASLYTAAHRKTAHMNVLCLIWKAFFRNHPSALKSIIMHLTAE